VLSPSLSSSGTGTGGGGCSLKGGVRVFCPECPDGGGRRGGQVLPRIVVTCPGSQGTSCPCSPSMIRVEVPGSSFMLCLGPGPSSLLHLTRAIAEKPYAGGTTVIRKVWRIVLPLYRYTIQYLFPFPFFASPYILLSCLCLLFPSSPSLCYWLVCSSRLS